MDKCKRSMVPGIIVNTMAISSRPYIQMLDEDDLTDADEELLDMLGSGRITAPYTADKSGYTIQYLRDRLRRLVEHGYVVKVYDGLYELDTDPRDVGDDE